QAPAGNPSGAFHARAGKLAQMSRPLTASEYTLARWMLEHGKPEAVNFLPQLESAKVSTWKCPCGCASFNFDVPAGTGGMNILGDFLFGDSDSCCGIFIWERDGKLEGVEVCGYAVDAPKVLPLPEELKSVPKS
ncbi:MAG TPA: hypothetical protein VMP01_00285, partial [Pirellulaceae bacterium]|nr:hypothetical protein [Pirellulaceae bacterium]